MKEICKDSSKLRVFGHQPEILLPNLAKTELLLAAIGPWKVVAGVPKKKHPKFPDLPISPARLESQSSANQSTTNLRNLELD